MSSVAKIEPAIERLSPTEVEQIAVRRRGSKTRMKPLDLPLDQMTAREQSRAIETIWEDLAHDERQVKSRAASMVRRRSLCSLSCADASVGKRCGP